MRPTTRVRYTSLRTTVPGSGFPISVGLACFVIRPDNLLIYIGLALVGGLLFTKRSSARVSTDWSIAAVVLIFCALPLPHLFSRLGSSQYNLTELFRQDKWSAGARLALLFLWAPLTARWAAVCWSRGKYGRAVTWAVGSCLVGWGFLRRSVTLESIDDVFGSTVLGLPWDAEYVLRLACLYYPFLWLPVFFVLLALTGRKGIVAWALFAGMLLAFAGPIIQRYSPSDNVRELLRGNGAFWIAALSLFTTWAAVLCHRMGYRWAIGVAVASAVPAWGMLLSAVQTDTIHGLDLSFPLFALVFVALLFCVIPVTAPHRPPTQ